MMVRLAENFRQRNGARTGWRAADHGNKTSLLACARLVQVTHERGAVGRQTGGLEQVIRLAQFPRPAVLRVAGMHGRAVAKIDEGRQRMFRFPAGFQQGIGIQFAQPPRVFAPALVEGVIAEGLPLRGQAGLEAVHALHPKLDPFADGAARVRDAAEIHQGVVQVAQHDEMAGDRIGRLADEHAQPQRGALVTGVDGNGTVSVGELPDCGGGGGCGHESFVSIPPPVCKAKVVSSARERIRFSPKRGNCELGLYGRTQARIGNRACRQGRRGFQPVLKRPD